MACPLFGTVLTMCAQSSCLRSSDVNICDPTSTWSPSAIVRERMLTSTPSNARVGLLFTSLPSTNSSAT